MEDRSSSSIFLDDRKVEELSTGRDRGAGIRVVVGETTGFAHTADLSEAGLLDAAEAAAAVARAGGGGSATIALAATHRPSARGRRALPDAVPKSTKVDLLAASRRRFPRRRRSHRPGERGLRRQPSPHPRGELRRSAGQRRACPDSVLRAPVWPRATAGMQTGSESLAYTLGFEMFDEHPVEEAAEKAARRAHHQAHRPSRPLRRAARRAQVRERRLPVPRGVRSRARGRPHLEGQLGVHRSRRPARSRARASPSSTTAPSGRTGAPSPIDDEGRPTQRNVLIQDGVLTDYMWDYLRARKQGRVVVRQRAAPELRGPAHGPHDQHLPPRRRRGPR